MDGLLNAVAMRRLRTNGVLIDMPGRTEARYRKGSQVKVVIRGKFVDVLVRR